MTRYQQNILWIGIIVVLVFLFTDQNFRNKLFGRGTSKPVTTSVPYTAAQIFQMPNSTDKIILDAASGLPATSRQTVTTA
jgi:hypothetical protein